MSDLSETRVIRPDWPAPANVHALSTTRQGGVSAGPWSSLNLGRSCGDDPQHVLQNRRALSKLLPSAPRWLHQVHGINVVDWEHASEPGVQADAIVASQKGQVCAIMTADCLPVLFCNQAGTHVAAAHAGWRGLAAGVLQATVLAMQCKPVELMVWLGPAIGPQAFEVGRDVYDAFVDQQPESIHAFNPRGDRWLADLYQLARLALAGVGVSRVFGGGYCTWSEPEKFFSYRRDRVTGRMASLVWIEK